METAQIRAVVGVVFLLSCPVRMGGIHPSLVFIHGLFQFLRQLISNRAGRSFFGRQLVAHLTEVGAIGPSRTRQLGS